MELGKEQCQDVGVVEDSDDGRVVGDVERAEQLEVIGKDLDLLGAGDGLLVEKLCRVGFSCFFSTNLIEILKIDLSKAKLAEKIRLLRLLLEDVIDLLHALRVCVDQYKLPRIVFDSNKKCSIVLLVKFFLRNKAIS